MKQYIYLVFYFLLISILNSPHIADATITYPYLDDNGFTNLRYIAHKITETCPPETCIIAFVGRSNVLVSAYLEAQGILNLVNLPGTGIGNIPADKMSIAQNNFQNYVLTPLLKPELAGRKKILVVDFVNSGSTLVRVAEWIRSFSKEHGHFETAAFCYGENISATNSEALFNAKISHEYVSSGDTLKEGSLGFLMKDSLIEYHAPYRSWYPLVAQSEAIFNRKLRRKNLNHSGSQSSFFASYDDLVKLFKLPKPFAKIKKARNCSGTVLATTLN